MKRYTKFTGDYADIMSYGLGIRHIVLNNGCSLDFGDYLVELDDGTTTVVPGVAFEEFHTPAKEKRQATNQSSKKEDPVPSMGRLLDILYGLGYKLSKKILDQGSLESFMNEFTKCPVITYASASLVVNKLNPMQTAFCVEMRALDRDMNEHTVKKHLSLGDTITARVDPKDGVILEITR